jgi:hypothetical protein
MKVSLPSFTTLFFRILTIFGLRRGRNALQLHGFHPSGPSCGVGKKRIELSMDVFEWENQ